jgi:hypothetical protein
MKASTGLSLLSFCLIGIALLGCGKNNPSSVGGTGSNGMNGNLVNYAGTFVSSGGNDSTKATGTVAATFNTSTLELKYSFSWKSLTSDPVQMHFHDDGPVIVKLTGFPVTTDGIFSGSAFLSTAQGADLASGNIYAMIHTQNYTAGEIMATLKKQ